MNLKKVPKQDYEPEQHGPVFNYLYSLKTHFLTMMSVNFLFLVFNIPMMLVAFGFVLVFLPYMNDVFVPTTFAQFMYDSGVVGNETINDVGSEAAFQIYYLIVLFCVMLLLGSTLLVIGPFQAGFAQIYRNFYRQEGVFLFNDFKEGVKNNWKQSLGASIISFVFTTIDLLSIGFYLNLGTRFGTVAATVFVLLFFIFIVIQNMVYTMIVSREISLPKIYKNAFLFFLMKFGPCMGLIFLLIVMLIVIPAMLMVTTTYFAYALVVIYYLTLVFGIIQYAFAFFTGELIKEYIEPLSPTPVPEEDELYDEDESEDESEEKIEEEEDGE